MTYNSKTKKYVYQYKADKIKRIPLDVQLDEYARIKAAADQAGESVNGYIKTAIRARLAADLAAGVQAVGADPVPLGDMDGGISGGVTLSRIPEKEKAHKEKAHPEKSGKNKKGGE